MVWAYHTRVSEWRVIVVTLEDDVSGIYLWVRVRSGMRYLHNAGARCPFAITSLLLVVINCCAEI